MKRIVRLVKQVLGNERGTAAVEFVMMFPVVFALFLVSFEQGYLALRATMLGRALDLTVRDLRLGNLSTATADQLRQSLCSRTDLFKDCKRSVTIELTRIDALWQHADGAKPLHAARPSWRGPRPKGSIPDKRTS